MRRILVSRNRRFLAYEDGSPFFYLADTAWELFHRLNREESDLYLRNRAAKGFTVIQAVVLAELDGLHTPNRYGNVPFVNDDPDRPVEAYFEHVDWVVRRAGELGLTIGMLPTWGDKWNASEWGVGPEIFTPSNARIYGEWLGRRYRQAPILWILGGDRPVETDTHREIVEAMAEGLSAGDGGSHLRTFHPCGQQTSAQYFHDAAWLDFNMAQTGHTYDRDNFRTVAEMYALTPPKPCLDGEPGYEDHPSGFDAAKGFMGAEHVRKFVYWALFAGACGHTYGCHDIWQMYDPSRQPVTAARTPWQEALDLPGAGQMQHARALIESRPFFSRVPDLSVLACDPGEGADHLQATRDAEGAYMMVYTSVGRAVAIDVSVLSGTDRVAWWYDPRTGGARPADGFSGGGVREFTPPTSGPGEDWVLVVDDAERGLPEPGKSG